MNETEKLVAALLERNFGKNIGTRYPDNEADTDRHSYHKIDFFEVHIKMESFFSPFYFRFQVFQQVVR